MPELCADLKLCVIQKSLNLSVRRIAEITHENRHGSGHNLEICVKNLTSYVRDLMKGFIGQGVRAIKKENFRRWIGIL